MGKPIDINLLICPQCKSKIINENHHKIICEKCGLVYSFKNKTLIFNQLDINDFTDNMDKLKSVFKKWSKLYDGLIRIISPVFLQMGLKKFIRKHIKGKNVVAINLGSGNSDIAEEITNIDIFPYKNVNICCNIDNIPISTSSVDVVINIAVLEHVASPENVMNEIHRILKKGGIIYTYFPFIQPYHASPYDYSRRTIEGIKELHRDFKIEEVRIGAGPTSGFLWVFQEWLSIILSFGIKQIHHYVYLFIMIITFPLKYLDLFLSKYVTATHVASAFIIIAKKK